MRGWLRAMGGDRRPTAPGHDELHAALKGSFNDYPQFTDTVGNVIAATVLQIGSRGLVKLKPPTDDNFAHVAARFAARCTRGVAKPGGKMSSEECRKVIGMVEEWGSLSSIPVLSIGYEGSSGTYAERAHVLAYDSLACIDLAAELPGGEARPSFIPWEMASEMHCYSAVSLNPSILLSMDHDFARTFAASAVRFSRILIASTASDIKPSIPEFLQAHGPMAVFSMSNRLFHDGLPPRRSEIAIAAATAPP
jgi:hypothetical protein